MSYYKIVTINGLHRSIACHPKIPLIATLGEDYMKGIDEKVSEWRDRADDLRHGRVGIGTANTGMFG